MTNEQDSLYQRKKFPQKVSKTILMQKTAEYRENFILFIMAEGPHIVEGPYSSGHLDQGS